VGKGQVALLEQQFVHVAVGARANGADETAGCVGGSRWGQAQPTLMEQQFVQVGSSVGGGRWRCGRVAVGRVAVGCARHGRRASGSKQCRGGCSCTVSPSAVHQLHRQALGCTVYPVTVLPAQFAVPQVVYVILLAIAQHLVYLAANFAALTCAPCQQQLVVAASCA